MALQPPPVAQFSLPNPGQAPQGTAPTSPNVPPVAQFQLPAAAQVQTQQNVFSTPLSNIAAGNAPANIAESVGALKGGLGELRQVAGVDTNPVMQSMVSKSPAMSQALESEKQYIQPQNLEEAKGAAASQLGAALVGVPEVKSGAAVGKGLMGQLMTGKTDPVLEAVSPRLTPKVAAETATQTKGLLRKISPVTTKRLQGIADAIRPYFQPGAPFSQNAQNAEKAITQEANGLENMISQVDHPIVIKELGARLRGTAEPISLKGTSFAKQIGPLKQAAVDLTRESGGTVKGTFQALRKFDDLVDRTWPTLWDRESAPMRNAVTAIRNEWKDFIAENLPNESVYRDSLDKQTNLFNARDVLREKAALGELQKQGEIGTTGIQRMAAAHPLLMNTARASAGILGTGILGGEVAGRVLNRNQ